MIITNFQANKEIISINCNLILLFLWKTQIFFYGDGVFEGKHHIYSKEIIQKLASAYSNFQFTFVSNSQWYQMKI